MTNQHQIEVVRWRLSGRFKPGQRVRLPLDRPNVNGMSVHRGTVTADDGVSVTVEWDSGPHGKHVGVLTRGGSPANANKLQLDRDTVHQVQR